MYMKIDLLKHNSTAWDNEVDRKSEWTIPATREQIKEAFLGKILIKLTPVKYAPTEWIGEVKNKNILCLASGGGQQGPILAAAGANVSVLDNSIKQLQQDKFVAERENIKLETIIGDMRNLEMFSDSFFDIIINPVSIQFIEDVQSVWSECARTLKPGGILLSAAINPLIYIFDYSDFMNKNYVLKYSIPYSDIDTFSDNEKQNFIDNKIPFEFGHSIEDIIQGQISCGFTINGFYEDNNGGKSDIDKYINSYFALSAVKASL